MSDGEIAGFIEGNQNKTDSARIAKHLQSCRQCFDIYQDAAINRGLLESGSSAFDSSQDLIELGKQVFSLSDSSEDAREEGKHPPKRSWFGRHFRLRFAMASVIAIAAVGLMWISLDRGGDAGPDQMIPLPIRHALEQASMSGNFVLPGGEGGLAVDGGARRSGYVPLTDALESSLDDLFSVYQDGAASLDDVYWLLAGYVTTGQMDAARILAESALKTYPSAPRLLILDGIIAYRDGDLDRAQDRLLEAYENNPDDAVTALNVAIVMGEKGDVARAEELLKGIVREHVGTSLAARAGEILGER
jgi:tetratricopeptide (TPR) repeat protein